MLLNAISVTIDSEPIPEDLVYMFSKTLNTQNQLFPVWASSAHKINEQLQNVEQQQGLKVTKSN